MKTTSLPGMTQGARKRAARAKAIGTGAYTTPRMKRLLVRDFGGIMRLRSNWLAPVYAFARWAYRLGERLRPCPGCCACDPDLRCTDAKRSGCPHRVCDGSGVLPARAR